MVYATIFNWFYIKLKDGRFGWISDLWPGHNSQGFTSTYEDLPSKGSIVGNDWDRRLYDAPAGSLIATAPDHDFMHRERAKTDPYWRLPDFDVDIKKIRIIDGTYWMLVDVYNGERCYGEPERVFGTGWAQVSSAGGDPYVYWGSPRGC